MEGRRGKRRVSLLRGRIEAINRPRSRWISALKFWQLAKDDSVVLRFTSIEMSGARNERYRLRSEPVVARAKSPGRRVVIPGAVAAVGGAIVAGPLGAAGGGVATTAVAGWLGKDRVPKGTRLSVKVLDDIAAR